MLDTNVFNRLLDGKLEISKLAVGNWIVTGIQRAELGATGNERRRLDLLAQIDNIVSETVLSASAVFDVAGAGFDEAYFNDGSGLFERMLARLEALDGGKGKKPKDKRNQLRDVVIAETAIKEEAIFVTADLQLADVVEEFGGKTILIP